MGRFMSFGMPGWRGIIKNKCGFDVAPGCYWFTLNLAGSVARSAPKNFLHEVKTFLSAAP